MNAYNANGGFAASARTATCSVSSHGRRSPVAAAHDDPTPELHNARGLVIAIMMSAACWAGVGLALLL
jgi:hypothetical protein